MLPRRPIELLTNPSALQESLELARALSHLEVVLTLDGQVQRCPLRLAGDNAVIVADLTQSTLLQIRARSGTLRLIGFDEYASPSTPPRKYRVQTIGGFWNDQNSNSGGCVGCDSQGTEEFSGAFEYSADGRGETNSQIANFYNRPTTAPCDRTSIPFVSSSQPARDFRPYDGEAHQVIPIATQTVKTWDFVASNPACYIPAGFTFYRHWVGAVIATLSGEDTEADAINRFRVATGWGPWRGVGPSLPARYEERTTDVTAVYCEQEYRIRRIGMPPGATISASLNVYRRVFGVGAYELYQTLWLSGTVDAAGVLTITGSVPNDPGFETYVDNAVIQV